MEQMEQRNLTNNLPCLCLGANPQLPNRQLSGVSVFHLFLRPLKIIFTSSGTDVFPILNGMFLDHLHPPEDDVTGYDLHVTEPVERTLVNTLDGIKIMLGRLGMDGPEGQLGCMEFLSNSISDPDGLSLGGAVTDAAAAISESLGRVADALNNIAQAINRS